MRKWKKHREFGEPIWEFEIGEPPKAFNPEADLLAPSGDNVQITKESILAYIYLANIYKKRHP